MSRAAVRVDALVKAFGPRPALSDLSLSIPEGAILGLLGPNGAGKSTLVRVLSTILRPDRGRATVCGYDVVGDAHAVRTLIGVAGQYTTVDEALTGHANLVLIGRLHHLGGREARRRTADLIERLSLTDVAGRQVRTYSGGTRRRLDLAVSLIGRPRVVFLDEPTNGLDPRTRLQVWDRVEELARDGTTVLLTTQHLDEADRLAHLVAVIEEGRILAQGTPAELRSRMGAQRLEVTLADCAHLAAAATALVPVADGDARVTLNPPRIVVPLAGGATALPDAVRRLDTADITVAELALRHPSLEEAFLTLTTPGRSGTPDRDVAVRPAAAGTVA